MIHRHTGGFPAVPGLPLAVDFQDKVFKRLPLFQSCKINCTVNDCLGQEVVKQFPVIQLKPKQTLLAWRRFLFFVFFFVLFSQEAVKNERNCVSREEEKMPLHQGLLAA